MNCCFCVVVEGNICFVVVDYLCCIVNGLCICCVGGDWCVDGVLEVVSDRYMFGGQVGQKRGDSEW